MGIIGLDKRTWALAASFILIAAKWSLTRWCNFKVQFSLLSTQLCGIRRSLVRSHHVLQAEAVAIVLCFMASKIAFFSACSYCLEAFDTNGVERSVGIETMGKLGTSVLGQCRHLFIPSKMFIRDCQ
jgi:hypothetical protein